LHLERAAELKFEVPPGINAETIKEEVFPGLFRVGGVDPGKRLFGGAATRPTILQQRDLRSPTREVIGNRSPDNAGAGDNDTPTISCQTCRPD
jgi:hypothetical protein